MKIPVRLALTGLVLFTGLALGPYAATTSAETAGPQYFPETGHYVKGAFWKYWQEHGALMQQGYPISEELQERSDTDGKTYTMQYFERAVFEYHPENRPPNDVLLSLLGNFRYKQEYPNGAPGQKPNGDPGTVYFPQTGKHIGGSFLVYWRKYGDVAQQGYPISEEFQERSDLDGNIYTVQYFERAVFEWHPRNQPPYNVLLSQLGTFRYRAKYPQPAPQPPAPPSPPTPAPAPYPPAGPWTTPVNVSHSGWYDRSATIAAGLSGSVSIGWEERDEPTNTTNRVMLAGNGSVGGGLNNAVLRTNTFKESGHVRMAHDSLGRRHMVYWAVANGGDCEFYTRIEANGSVSVNETVPNTCGRGMQETSIAVGPDLSVHILFGTSYKQFLYYLRTDNGAWPVQGETVVASGSPTQGTVAVTTQGAVIVAYRAAAASGTGSDIYVATRRGANSWTPENISSTCCTGCPGTSATYLPALAPDPSGGMRASWADEQCDPRATPRLLDLYYREWQPNRGWQAGPNRIVRDPGEVYYSAMVVDSSGAAHIVYETTVGTAGDYRLFYVHGSGTGFSAPEGIFTDWTNGSYAKNPSLDYSPGYLHLVFDTERDGNKEVYYTHKPIGH